MGKWLWRRIQKGWTWYYFEDIHGLLNGKDKENHFACSGLHGLLGSERKSDRRKDWHLYKTGEKAVFKELHTSLQHHSRESDFAKDPFFFLLVMSRDVQMHQTLKLRCGLNHTDCSRDILRRTAEPFNAMWKESKF